jgi:hypothetical protein
MIASFPKLIFNGKSVITQSTFQYGSICIHKDFRANGILLSIFKKMRLEMLKKYPTSITFINRKNRRSLSTHTQKLNGAVIDEFQFNDKIYFILGFDMRNSVL